MSSLQSQGGQGLVEAMLALAVLGGMLFYVHSTGDLQHVASKLLSQSTYQAFLAAKGVVTDSPSTAILPGTRLGVAFFGSPVEQELLRVPGLIAMAAESSKYSRLRSPRQQASPGLHRRTYLHTGTGHASSDALTQDRVAQSGLVWQRASLKSRALAGFMAPGVARNDQPWHRPSIDTDWLGKWSGFVPRQAINGALN